MYKVNIFYIFIFFQSITNLLAMDSLINKRIVSISPKLAKAKLYDQLQAINLRGAHQISKGKGVIVAVIDSGVKIDLPGLKSNIWVNNQEIPNNGIDDDDNGYIDDTHGWNFDENTNDVMDANYHGTASASVIGSSLLGVAPMAKLMAIRVSDSRGKAELKNIFLAIEYAMNMGAKVINISFRVFTLNRLNAEQLEILDRLEKKEVILVMSAGNQGEKCGGYPSPYAIDPYKNTISVSALSLGTTTPHVTEYSNFGRCYTIAAPAGVRISNSNNKYSWGILSTFSKDVNKFYLYSGTSAAAPVVSGAMALLIAAKPQESRLFLKKALLESSKARRNLRGKVFTSSIVDPLNALKILVSREQTFNNL